MNDLLNQVMRGVLPQVRVRMEHQLRELADEIERLVSMHSHLMRIAEDCKTVVGSRTIWDYGRLKLQGLYQFTAGAIEMGQYVYDPTTEKQTDLRVIVQDYRSGGHTCYYDRWVDALAFAVLANTQAGQVTHSAQHLIDCIQVRLYQENRSWYSQPGS